MPIRYSLLMRLLYLVTCSLMSTLLLSCDVVTVATPDGTPSFNSQHLNTWLLQSSGIELRYEQWNSPENISDIITIVRLDPKHIHLSVDYHPDQPLTMNSWMKQTGAQVLINGGYFDKNYRPSGLLISDGEAHGASYQGFGGMLAVDASGRISLRSLGEQPYDPSEQLQQVTQSAPLLMLNGQRTQFTANSVNDRRSVVAIDKHGNLLFIVSPGRAFTLDELADILVSSDLELKTALNLDGGASTGFYVNTHGQQQVSIEPFTALPIVIAVK
ncbi:MAG: phosphodiester glycosidase family protein [Chloroflexi bacterium]|nr:MAG: phosphodiester glycosidase family protein [Chloroflexota bacterium]